MNNHNLLGQISLPIRCLQTGCHSYFVKLYNLYRHIEKFHCKTINLRETTNCIVSKLPKIENVSINVNHDIECYQNQLKLSNDNNKYCANLNTTEQEAAALVASLRANSSIPYSIIPNIIQCARQLLKIQASNTRNNIINCINSLSLQQDFRKELLSTLQQCCEEAEETLSNLSTHHKQDLFFEKHPLFVKPDFGIFGLHYEYIQNENQLVYGTFQYVSVEVTLRSLCQSKAYMELLLKGNKNDAGGLYNEFQNSETYRTALYDPSKLVILIELFYDGMGTTNPLRGQSTMCNVGVFYYVIKNLPTNLTSCHANVHLLALCYSHDLRVYGYDTLLNKFVTEIQRLILNGFEGDFPIIGKTHIYVKLCQAVCDNLALNGLFGFVECFSYDYFCTMCLATQNNIQDNFREENFDLRTIETYNNDLNVALSGTLPATRKHEHGIETSCALNKITGYHITHNYALDPMHILLEGIISVEIGLVLYELVTVQKFVKISDLNTRLNDFFVKNYVDKRNKSPTINSFDSNGGGLSPSMKAVQMWSLLRYLPLIIGNKIPHDNDYWLFLLHLSELVDLIFAPSFTRGMIAYLSQLISEHLHLFKKLFGNNVRLKPKHHLLVHLPTIITKSGPLIGMCYLRYELKNSFFKRSANIMCNFTNVCKILAYRHQCYLLDATLSGHHIRNYVVPGKVNKVCLMSAPYCNAVCAKLGCERTDLILTTSK